MPFILRKEMLHSVERYCSPELTVAALKLYLHYVEHRSDGVFYDYLSPENQERIRDIGDLSSKDLPKFVNLLPKLFTVQNRSELTNSTLDADIDRQVAAYTRAFNRQRPSNNPPK